MICSQKTVKITLPSKAAPKTKTNPIVPHTVASVAQTSKDSTNADVVEARGDDSGARVDTGKKKSAASKMNVKLLRTVSALKSINDDPAQGWRRKFLPTWIFVTGCYGDPFAIPDDLAEVVLPMIYDKVYSGNDVVNEPAGLGSAVFYNVSVSSYLQTFNSTYSSHSIGRCSCGRFPYRVRQYCIERRFWSIDGGGMHF